MNCGGLGWSHSGTAKRAGNPERHLKFFCVQHPSQAKSRMKRLQDSGDCHGVTDMCSVCSPQCSFVAVPVPVGEVSIGHPRTEQLFCTPHLLQCQMLRSELQHRPDVPTRQEAYMSMKGSFLRLERTVPAYRNHTALHKRHAHGGFLGR